jgi:hypothetical protein
MTVFVLKDIIKNMTLINVIVKINIKNTSCLTCDYSKNR